MKIPVVAPFALLALLALATTTACAVSVEETDELGEDGAELSLRPTLTIASTASAPPGTRFDVRFDSRAPDGSRATVTASPMPTGAMISPIAEGFLFSWTPRAADVGEHKVVFTARANGRRTVRTVRLVVSDDAVSMAIPTGALAHEAKGTLRGQVRLTSFGNVLENETAVDCTLTGSNPGAATARCTVTIDQHTFSTRDGGWKWQGPWKITKEAVVDRVTGAFFLRHSEPSGRNFDFHGKFRPANGGGFELWAKSVYTLTWREPWGGTGAAIHETDGSLPLTAQ